MFGFVSQLKQKPKKKLQKLPKKCIRFCLNLNNSEHIGLTEFEKIIWLSINDHFEQCVSSTTFKFFNSRSPAYDVFKLASHPNTNTTVSFLKLMQPLQNTNYGEKTLSYLAPNIWNSLPVYLKATESLSTYKHKIKKHFLDRMKNDESDIYIYIYIYIYMYCYF